MEEPPPSEERVRGLRKGAGVKGGVWGFLRFPQAEVQGEREGRSGVQTTGLSKLVKA